MDLGPLRKQHPSGFGTVFLNLDLNAIFKRRDSDGFNSDRDFCVYTWKDSNDTIQYIGMGRYYDLSLNKPGKGASSRPYKHRKDMLVKAIDSTGTCEILYCGCTSKEAHIIEAYLISIANRELSKFGQYKGDGNALINKKREKKYEGMFEEYLNLDNGNNYWETFRRQVNNNQG